MTRVFKSNYPDIDIPDMPIHEYVFEGAADRAGKMAIIDGPTGRSYDYPTLAGAVKMAAGGLTARGFGKGDVLAIVAPNLPEYAIVFHAVSTVGGTVTTVNPTYGTEEIAFQLKDARAKEVVTIALFLDAVKEAAATVGIEEIFVIGEAEGATPVTSLLQSPFEGEVSFDNQTDVAVLPYSSGTTGFPKGVMLTHSNLVANIAQTNSAAGFEPEAEVCIAVLPFFHIYGMQVLMNGMLRLGETIVTMPRFDLVEFLELIQKYKVTRAFVVPPIVLALAKHPIIDNYDLSSLVEVFSGAAPLGAELAAEASARLGVPVVQGYGLTETSPVATLSPPGTARAGTVGVLVPNSEMRLVDPESGEDKDVGAEGEIWFRGPHIMAGYLNNQEATDHTIDSDGWLHTGDIGMMDADGYLAITDRLKELIKYKGFQVPPAELEALIITHPDVADCAVIGVADEEAGELPKAYVTMKPGVDDLTLEALQGFCGPHLATYKQIQLLELIDEIPKSASGKILRRLLRDRETA